MKKNMIVVGLLLIGGLIVFSSGLFAESITLSTYYPAPFGAYDRLKLVPRDSLPLDPNCNDKKDLGIMYYDNGKGDMIEGLYVCQAKEEDEFNWVRLGQRIADDTQPAKKAKVVCVREDGMLGVCINNPSFDGTCGCK